MNQYMTDYDHHVVWYLYNHCKYSAAEISRATNISEGYIYKLVRKPKGLYNVDDKTATVWMVNRKKLNEPAKRSINRET